MKVHSLNRLTTFLARTQKEDLNLVRGTKATSLIFIVMALLIATGALFAANSYYDLDTGEVITEEVQRITQLTRATGGLIAGGGASDTLASGVKLQVSSGSLRVGDGNFTVATSGNTYVGGTTTFATSVEVQGTLDPNYMAAYTLSGDITGTSSPNITGIGTFSGATATLASIVQSPEFSSAGGTTTVGSAGGKGIRLNPASGEVKLATDSYIETPNGYRIATSGKQVLREMVPVMGFDLPVQCNTACDSEFATVTRTTEDINFSDPYQGATRKYKFVIRYADANTGSNVTWEVATSSNVSSLASFTVSNSSTIDVSTGETYITGPVSFDPTTNSWFLRVNEKAGAGTGYDLRIYEVYLAAYDQID